MAGPSSNSTMNQDCHEHDVSRTPTKVSRNEADVGSPNDRLKVKKRQDTPPTHESLTPMSTCSSSSRATSTTETSEVESPSSSTASQSQQQQQQHQSGATATTSIRIPLPSPSRGRLDRQYAKRLAASSYMYHQYGGATHSSNSKIVNKASTESSSDTRMSALSFSTIVPPPGISREITGDSSFFRPTPINTHNNNVDSSMQDDPKQFFFSSSVDGHVGNITPTSTPSSLSSRRRRRTQTLTACNMMMDLGTSDRFIPSRATSNMNSINLWESMKNGSSRYNHQYDNTSNANVSPSGSDGNNNINTTDDTNSASSTGSVNPTAAIRNNDPHYFASSGQQNLHNILLRSELLGENISPYHLQQQLNPSSSSSYSPRANNTLNPLRDNVGMLNNRLRFQSPRQAYHENIYHGGPTSVVNSFSLTPFGNASSQRLMAAPPKRRRKIAKVPFKVLDAPALQDDFYLNLVDWSSQNVLAVGLGSCVYLWSACTSKVTKLCDLAQAEDIVTSVSWAQRGTHLAVGTNKGEVQLWDTIKVKKVRTMTGHSARVGTLAWSGPILASGSRDRLIFLRDVRVQSNFTDRLNAHRQEVCGLRWSFDEPAFLASGGNDNQLHVVDSRNPVQPVHRFSDHTAAVKAIAWSPHQHGLLASGGGTADRCIRFWNTLSGSALSSVDTGSQVCNLAWSQNCNEIVSTHGYSLNQIVVWRYPSLSKVVTLTGHTYRVLYLAVSPDGSTIVTGAGDETLRFWQVFPGPRSDAKNNAGGLLFPNTLGSVIR